MDNKFLETRQDLERLITEGDTLSKDLRTLITQLSDEEETIEAILSGATGYLCRINASSLNDIITNGEQYAQDCQSWTQRITQSKDRIHAILTTYNAERGGGAPCQRINEPSEETEITYPNPEDYNISPEYIPAGVTITSLLVKDNTITFTAQGKYPTDEPSKGKPERILKSCGLKATTSGQSGWALMRRYYAEKKETNEATGETISIRLEDSEHLWGDNRVTLTGIVPYSKQALVPAFLTVLGKYLGVSPSVAEPKKE